MTCSGKILLVANNFPPVRGGSAVVYGNLARHLGQQIVVLAPAVSYVDGLPTIGWREHDRHAPYRVIRLPLLRTRIEPRPRGGRLGRLRMIGGDLIIRLQVASVLVWLIVSEGVRTVCVGELIASRWIIELCRRLPKVRTIAYVHGEEITTQDDYDLQHRRAREALRAVDRIVAVSHFTEGAVCALLGENSAAKISLIENGVDTSRFRRAEKRHDLVERYDLWDCFVFVSVCRLLEKKGIDHAIRAFTEVAQRHPQCRYLVVGTGPYEAELHRLAQDVGVGTQVVFAGDVSEADLVPHYCLGDVFVMPNRKLANGDTEGFGLVFLEANACGLPVIAGRDGGSRDAVQNGVNGLVVDGHSIEEIRRAMLTMIEDEALQRTLREGAAVKASGADWRSRAADFLDLCCPPVAAGA